METTFEGIIAAAENLDWSVADLRVAGFQVDKGIMQLEFEKYSPAGEDFSFVVESSCAEELVDEIGAFSAGFDTEEHIKMWIQAKEANVGGVPNIKELVADADAIENMLRELAEAVIYGVLEKAEAASQT